MDRRVSATELRKKLFDLLKEHAFRRGQVSEGRQ
jgi:hypothetical protein